MFKKSYKQNKAKILRKNQTFFFYPLFWIFFGKSLSILLVQIETININFKKKISFFCFRQFYEALECTPIFKNFLRRLRIPAITLLYCRQIAHKN